MICTVFKRVLLRLTGRWRSGKVAKTRGANSGTWAGSGTSCSFATLRSCAGASRRRGRFTSHQQFREGTSHEENSHRACRAHAEHGRASPCHHRCAAPEHDDHAVRPPAQGHVSGRGRRRGRQFQGPCFCFQPRQHRPARCYGPKAAQLLEFDANGKYLREIGHNLYGFGFAHTVRVDKDDNIWTTDKGTDMVVKFNPAGEVMLVLGASRKSADYGLGPIQRVNPPRPPIPGMFRQVTDVTWDNEGNIFVSDGYINSRVAMFDQNGNISGSFGEPGSGGASSTPRTPSPPTPRTTSMSATAAMAASRCSTTPESSSASSISRPTSPCRTTFMPFASLRRPGHPTRRRLPTRPSRPARPGRSASRRPTRPASSSCFRRILSGPHLQDEAGWHGAGHDRRGRQRVGPFRGHPRTGLSRPRTCSMRPRS